MRSSGVAIAVLTAVALAATGACGAGRGPGAGAPPEAVTQTDERTAPPPSAVDHGASPTTDSPSASAVVEVRYRVEVRSPDPAIADFPQVVATVLEDQRGWQRAGFDLRVDPEAEYEVVLAEPDDAQQLCLPYDVYRTYSCQNGPTVVINADRWRQATPQWTGDLTTYRVMLVNHEVGHLLGMRHPEVQCPGPGQLAPVMAQQSSELRGCHPNPWPLEHEIERAARHDLPLAPPYDR